MNLTHYFEATTTSSRGGRPDLSGQNSVVSARGPGNGQMTIAYAAGKRRSDDSVSILLDTDDDCPFKSTAIKKKPRNKGGFQLRLSTAPDPNIMSRFVQDPEHRYS